MNSPAPASAASVASSSTQKWQQRPRLVAPSPRCLALHRQRIQNTNQDQMPAAERHVPRLAKHHVHCIASAAAARLGLYIPEPQQ